MEQRADATNKMQTKLIMTFGTAIERNVSISVDNPKSDVTEEQIKAAMDVIVAQNIFAPYGSNLTKGIEAKIVVTDTTEYDLVTA